jgi:hypothetical protein
MRRFCRVSLGILLVVASLALRVRVAGAAPNGQPLLWYVIYIPAVEIAAQPPPQCHDIPNGVSCGGGLVAIPVTAETCNPPAYETREEAEADAQTRTPAGDWVAVQATDPAHAHALAEAQLGDTLPGSVQESPEFEAYDIERAAESWVHICEDITMPLELPTPAASTGPCPFTSAQLAALTTDTSALGGLGQTEAVDSLGPPGERLGVCAAFAARWGYTDEMLESDENLDENREHSEAILAFRSAVDASNVFAYLAARAQREPNTRFLATPSLGEEALATQSYHTAELVPGPDGRIQEVPDDADYTFVFRRGSLLIMSGDTYSADSADLDQALAFAEALDARVRAALR